MGTSKKDYWDRFRVEEVFTSSTPEKQFSMSEYAKKLHNAAETEMEDNLCEDDLLVSRSKSKLETEYDEAYVGQFEKSNIADSNNEDMQIFHRAAKKVKKKSKPAESERSSDLAFDEIEQPAESNKTEKAEKLPVTVFPLTKSKEKSEHLNLQEMENAILAAVPLVRHDGGLYYYNGRTYLALKSDMDLMELIRRHKVSSNCFQAHGIRIFSDLHVYLKTDPYLVPYDYEDRLRKSKNYVVLENGVLNVKKMELKPFDKKYLTFHSVKASWVENPNPRRFLRFLHEAAMGEPSIVCLTLEVMGCLLSSVNVKRFFVIGTAGNSGKSTLASLIKYLLGDEFVMSVSPNNLSDRFSLGDSRGKIVNLAMDIPNGKLNANAVSRIKNITGNDSITIEAKYMRPESTVSNLRFLFGTNYPVTLPREDDEDAFWERMVVIPFMRSVDPSEVDVDLLDKLIAEKDDIVSLCLQHLHDVIKNKYTFSPCPKGEAMKKSWRRAELSTASMYYFWNNCVEVTGNPKDTVYSSLLHGEYIRYCAENELETVPYIEFLAWIEKNTDPEMCVRKRIHRTNANPLSGFAGIKIR